MQDTHTGYDIILISVSNISAITRITYPSLAITAQTGEKALVTWQPPNIGQHSGFKLKVGRELGNYDNNNNLII